VTRTRKRGFSSGAAMAANHIRGVELDGRPPA
jgi:hypothetical protein